jgi:hypothetical protein
MAIIQAGGHAQVVQFFEDFLKQLKANPKIGYGVMIGVEEFTNDSMGGFVGDRLLDLKAEKAVRCVADHISEMRVNRTMPPRPPNAPANLVIYNVPAGSICFDFLNWIIDAEMIRRMEGAPPPLKVHFWFGRNGKDGLYTERCKQMFEHVVKPALELVGAIEHSDAEKGRYYITRHIREIVTQSREGVEIPKFKAPERSLKAMKKWLGGATPITITLREAADWEHRNSSLDAWIRFAKDLEAQGETVIFVRDTCKATEMLDGFRTCPDASLNLQSRCALYELAKANLFVANGPCELAKFGTKPYLVFTQIEPEGSAYQANTASFWKREALMDIPQDQYPWAAPNQRVVYQKDTYENICAAWEEINVNIPAPHTLSAPSNPNGKYIE